MLRRISVRYAPYRQPSSVGHFFEFLTNRRNVKILFGTTKSLTRPPSVYPLVLLRMLRADLLQFRQTGKNLIITVEH